jgi:hypothetical protein
MAPTYTAYPERPDHEERRDREARELRQEIRREQRLILGRAS